LAKHAGSGGKSQSAVVMEFRKLGWFQSLRFHRCHRSPKNGNALAQGHGLKTDAGIRRPVPSIVIAGHLFSVLSFRAQESVELRTDEANGIGTADGQGQIKYLAETVRTKLIQDSSLV
jgi:hypothetical protein